MNADIMIICDRDKFSARLQAFGERHFGRTPAHPAFPYHCAWVTENAIYDMNWKFRKVGRDHYDGKDVRIYKSPVPVSEAYLEMLVGQRRYGTLDVALYPILTPLGINAPGTHCAEAINDDLWFNGFRTSWIPYGAPPDPSAVLWWAEGNLQKLY
jgi:hypothetical protein